MKNIFLSVFITVICLSAQTQENPIQQYSYAYISVQGRAFSKKLKVEVDLGETTAQIKEGKEYSDTLSVKKSYAAIINYLTERDFDFVETRDQYYSVQGTGESYGFILIMRRRK